MRYDGGIRIARYEEFKLPYTAPWGFSMGEEGLTGHHGHGVISTEQLQYLFECSVQFLTARGKEHEPR